MGWGGDAPSLLVMGVRWFYVLVDYRLWVFFFGWWARGGGGNPLSGGGPGGLVSFFRFLAVPARRGSWFFPFPARFREGRVPSIVFVRDRQRFETEFPNLVVERIQPMLPFRYLVSGGISMRSLMPGFTSSSWKHLEKILGPRMSSLAMFAFVSVRRR